MEIEIKIRQGVPHLEILNEAKKKEVDLIVISSVGKTNIEKDYIGNVVLNVIKGSMCPVLLINNDSEQLTQICHCAQFSNDRH